MLELVKKLFKTRYRIVESENGWYTVYYKANIFDPFWNYVSYHKEFEEAKKGILKHKKPVKAVVVYEE